MKKLFVAFEGVDGTGKSTLAKAIAEKFKVNYTHNDKSYSYDEGMKKSYDYIETLKKMPTGVIDRLVHTGEGIYAPLYRDYDGSDYFDDLEDKMLNEFNILIVYVNATNENIISRLQSRGEDYVNIEHIDALKSNYYKYLNRTKIPFLIFDNDSPSIEKNIIKLSTLISAKINRVFNK